MGNVHVRKSKFPCGHSFSTKPKLILKSENAMKSIERRRNSMAECQARKRTNETVEKSESRKRANVECHTRKRTNETVEESESRKRANVECHTRKRANETVEESESRKRANVECHARKRTNETVEESESRKRANVECHTRKRANETVEESESRKRANVECHARKRANETLHQFQKRKQANLECQTRKRNQQTPLQSVIQSFIVKTKQGPDCVCKSCHRLMYKQSVVNLSVCKYVKASPELLSKVFDPEFKYSSHGGQEWICKTCHAALTCGKMPTQAIANCLKLSSIPPELSCLNSLELRLISLRLPFMKMVALPSGKQRCIHGPAVNVPSKLDNVCTVLPRLPSQSELVALKLKRKLSYKGHYMYHYVTHEKVLNALKWLKEHNPLYVDVEVDEEWSLHAETDDHDLYSSITANTDCSDTMAANSECTNVVNTSTDSSNIVSFDAGPSITNIESEISLNSELCNNSSMCDQEPTVNPTECVNISEHCDNNLVTAKHHLEQYASENDFCIHDVPGDGNCLYHAILYQLEQNNVISATVRDIRELVACYLEDHKEIFMPFVSSPIAPDNVLNSDTEIPSAVDASIASVTGPDTRSALVYARYVDRVRNGSWGDHVVIAAISNMYHVSVNVVQARQSGCTVSITSPVNDHSNCEVNLGLSCSAILLV